MPVLAACGGDPVPVQASRTVVLMGTPATLVTEAASRDAALARLERMVRIIETTEAQISTWRPDSELSVLNRQSVGTPLALSDHLCDLFDRLKGWYAVTGGVFDPGIGRLVETWDLHGRGRRPESADQEEACQLSGLNHFILDRERCVVQRRTDATLDAGGFGKGEALDWLRLADPGPWLVDFGGQVAVSGAGAWPVTVAHPLHRDSAAFGLLLGFGSLATSAGSERDLKPADTVRIGHIMDPRSCRPVVRDSMSVTVWHESAFVADVLSTSLFVMGREVGRPWAEARDIAACFMMSAPEGGMAFDATTAFLRQFPDPRAGCYEGQDKVWPKDR